MALFALTLLALSQQTASAASGFSSEAVALMSEYIPSPIYSQLLASVASAASDADVTGDPSALFFSAMAVDARPPAWFSSAVPSSYAAPIAALESALADLRLPEDTTVPSGVDTVLVTTVAASATGSAVPTSTSEAAAPHMTGNVFERAAIAVMAALAAL